MKSVDVILEPVTEFVRLAMSLRYPRFSSGTLAFFLDDLDGELDDSELDPKEADEDSLEVMDSEMHPVSTSATTIAVKTLEPCMTFSSSPIRFNFSRGVDRGVEVHPEPLDRSP